MHQSVNIIFQTVHVTWEPQALVYLKQPVFPLGDYDSNAMKMIYSFGLLLQQKCTVNLIYDNVFYKVHTARGNLIARKNEILSRRMTSNAI
jgi:hypothetical protein